MECVKANSSRETVKGGGNSIAGGKGTEKRLRFPIPALILIRGSPDTLGTLGEGVVK